MGMRANVERARGGECHRVDCAEIEFAILPRIDERVTIDSIEHGFTRTMSGLVSAVEHLVGTDGAVRVTVFVDFE